MMNEKQKSKVTGSPILTTHVFSQNKPAILINFERASINFENAPQALKRKATESKTSFDPPHYFAPFSKQTVTLFLKLMAILIYGRCETPFSLERLEEMDANIMSGKHINKIAPMLRYFFWQFVDLEAADLFSESEEPRPSETTGSEQASDVFQSLRAQGITTNADLNSDPANDFTNNARTVEHAQDKKTSKWVHNEKSRRAEDFGNALRQEINTLVRGKFQVICPEDAVSMIRECGAKRSRQKFTSRGPKVDYGRMHFAENYIFLQCLTKDTETTRILDKVRSRARSVKNAKIQPGKLLRRISRDSSKLKYGMGLKQKNNSALQNDDFLQVEILSLYKAMDCLPTAANLSKEPLKEGRVKIKSKVTEDKSKKNQHLIGRSSMNGKVFPLNAKEFNEVLRYISEKEEKKKSGRKPLLSYPKMLNAILYREIMHCAWQAVPISLLPASSAIHRCVSSKYRLWKALKIFDHPAFINLKKAAIEN